MSKVIVPTEKWVGLYADIANYILEYASSDPVVMEDNNGSLVYTPEKQDEFESLVDDVENIMSGYLTKGEI
tara:strand:+ start:1001 stop:1213 length:213 start_codon:yes stop_codon:yes gene_type:complete